MPTVFTHAIVPILAGKTVTDKKLPVTFWLVLIFCSFAPDLDGIGFAFGVKYESFFGHRGFFHSLFFALILAASCTVFILRTNSIRKKFWPFALIAFFAATASHCLLDAFTSGGLGIALFSPFDNTRIFFPYRPIWVSPLSIQRLFTNWGLRVMLSEIIWVWLPLTAAFGIAKFIRMKKYRLKQNAEA